MSEKEEIEALKRALKEKDLELKEKLKEKDLELKEKERKQNALMYVLYSIQRFRILDGNFGSCSVCTAWDSSHLRDFGY